MLWLGIFSSVKERLAEVKPDHLARLVKTLATLHYTLTLLLAKRKVREHQRARGGAYVGARGRGIIPR